MLAPTAGRGTLPPWPGDLAATSLVSMLCPGPPPPVCPQPGPAQQLLWGAPAQPHRCHPPACRGLFGVWPCHPMAASQVTSCCFRSEFSKLLNQQPTSTVTQAAIITVTGPQSFLKDGFIHRAIAQQDGGPCPCHQGPRHVSNNQALALPLRPNGHVRLTSFLPSCTPWTASGFLGRAGHLQRVPEEMQTSALIPRDWGSGISMMSHGLPGASGTPQTLV